ncbi:MAG TPA: hypothetical protein VMG12_18930, partial [Polyangiaceae bacterium]|nr:hypothetical protein [Polyangiaceae bacterium]
LTTEFFNDERLCVEVEYELAEAMVDNHVYVWLERSDGLMVLRSADDDYHPRLAETRAQRQPGLYTRRVFFPPNLLNEGVYQFRVDLGKRWADVDRQRSAFFRVEDRTDYRDSSLGKRKGVILFPLEWQEEYVHAEHGRIDLPSGTLPAVAAPDEGLEAERE